MEALKTDDTALVPEWWEVPYCHEHTASDTDDRNVRAESIELSGGVLAILSQDGSGTMHTVHHCGTL